MPKNSAIVIRRSFPWSDSVAGHHVTYRLLHEEDRDDLLKFARALPDEDQAFLRTDITSETTIDEWLENVKRGRTITIIAEGDDEILGFANLHHNEMLWTSHLAELRVAVAKQFRGHGLAKTLCGEIIAIAEDIDLQKVICYIPADRETLRHMFEHIGFQPEALLEDWIMAADDTLHDALVMVYDLESTGVR